MGAAELLREHGFPVVAGTHKEQIVRPHFARLLDKEGFHACKHAVRTRIANPVLGTAVRQSLGGREHRQRMDRWVQMGEVHHCSMSSKGRTGPVAAGEAGAWGVVRSTGAAASC